MGIKGLNKFLLEHNLIKTCNLSMFRGKTLAWDILSDLFKKQIAETRDTYNNKINSNGCYLRCVIDVITLFADFDIKLIPVFDGKKNKFKKITYKKRKQVKINASKKLENLEQELIIINKNIQLLNNEKIPQQQQTESILKGKELKEHKCEIVNQIIKTKKKCHGIKQEQIKEIQTFFDLLGIRYLVAKNEADGLCVELYSNKICDGVISSDTDLLVYHYNSLRSSDTIMVINKILPPQNGFIKIPQCTVYDKQEILNTLELSGEQFTEISILAGNDYVNALIQYKCNNKFVTPSLEVIINLIKHFGTTEVLIKAVNRAMTQPNNYDLLMVLYSNQLYTKIVELYTCKKNNSRIILDFQNLTAGYNKEHNKNTSAIKFLIKAGFNEKRDKKNLERIVQYIKFH